MWYPWTNHNSLLRIATNEIAAFCIDNSLRQMAFFRVRQSGQRPAFDLWQKKNEKSFICSSLFLYHYIKQIDSMLPCVCSVIDHRWRQNVVKTKKWHTSRRRVCHCCFYHILTSSVIYYWTDPRQHGIYLFYTMIRKEKDRYTYLPRTAWPFEDLC